MPTYDFRCPNGHLFEQRFARISDAPSTVPCPTCASIAERQISGGAGLVFKGSGFYITDYGKDGKKDQRTPAKPPANVPPGDAKGGDGKAGDAKSGDASPSSAPSESKASEPAPKPAASAPAPAAKPSGGTE
jgi:putative FmdB family regulatory protein